MHPLIHEALKSQLRQLPDLRPGYSVEVHQKIKEGEKERVQIFEGLIIKMGRGSGSEKTIMVRKIIEGVGVEKIFPLHSPNVIKVVVRKKGKVRRSKLYYMRDRSGKSARLQEAQNNEKMDQLIEEAVKENAKKEKAQEQNSPKKEETVASGVEKAV
ncbi:50S ribosomal protein L19 [Candidatus Peregrinibacteria bacterium]|nr:50S ribosomal protein L19 [Candidatus Peregrinibacteria bacterium]